MRNGWLIGLILFCNNLAAGEVMPTLSQLAHRTVTGKSCQPFDQKKAIHAINKVSKACSKEFQKSDLLKSEPPASSDKLTPEKVNDRLMRLLGNFHISEMNCLAQSAKDMAFDRKRMKDLANRARALRAVTQSLQNEVLALSKDPNIISKTCPTSLKQLQKDVGVSQEAKYVRCRKIISARNVRNVLLNALPMNAVDPLNKVLDSYSKMKGDRYKKMYPTESSIENRLARTYQDISGRLESGKKDFRDVVTNWKEGSNTNLFRQLLSDKKILKKVRDIGGNSKHLQGAMCRAEASYGKGRDYLDNGLTIGSIVLTGGAAAVARLGGAAALRAYHISSSARDYGLIGRGAMVSLQTALSSSAFLVNSGTIYSLIDQVCLSGAPDYKLQREANPSRTIQSVEDGSKPNCGCDKDVTAADQARESCIITSSMIIAGLPFIMSPGVREGLEAFAPAIGRGFDKGLNRIAGVSRVLNIFSEAPMKIAANGKVAVFARNGTHKALGKKTIRDLTAFDNHYEKLGFRTPEVTRVVLNERPTTLEFPDGPHLLAFDRARLGHQVDVPNDIIVMKPLYQVDALGSVTGRSKVVRDQSALLHERSHGLMYANYPDSSYIIKNMAMQEAFADFMSASFRNKPAVGTGAYRDGIAIRDIKSGFSSKDGVEAGFVRSTKDFNDSTANTLKGPPNLRGDHERSLLYSGVLWQIRESVGKEKAEKLIRPLIDNLNQNSYMVKSKSKAKTKEAKALEEAFIIPATKETFIGEQSKFAHFLAITRATAEEQGATAALPIIDATAKKNLLSARVKHYSKQLRSNRPVIRANGEVPKKPGQILLLRTKDGDIKAGQGYLLFNGIKIPVQ